MMILLLLLLLLLLLELLLLLLLPLPRYLLYNVHIFLLQLTHYLRGGGKGTDSILFGQAGQDSASMDRHIASDLGVRNCHKLDLSDPPLEKVSFFRSFCSRPTWLQRTTRGSNVFWTS